MSQMYVIDGKTVETVNFLAGECKHKCSYCWAKKMSKRFPQIAEKYSGEYRLTPEINKPLGRGKTIFVCSSNDLFQKEVEDCFINEILAWCACYPLNEYLFQTKNPSRYLQIPSLCQSQEWLLWFKKMNCWLGTTLESNRNIIGYDAKRLSQAPSIQDRVVAMSKLKNCKTYLTLEPLCAFDKDEFLSMINFASPDRIFIGADTGHNDLPEPSRDEAITLIEALKPKYEVILKSNLARIIGKEMVEKFNEGKL